MTHSLKQSFKDRLKNLIPFGVGHTKPKHFRDMLRVLWINRDNLPYAWKVVTRGVCDGCALGVAGLHDWTIPGIHLCMTRLNLLRLNTMPAMDPTCLADLEALRQKLAATAPAPIHRSRRPRSPDLEWDNTQLRNLGRLAFPMVRRKGDPGFKRISWDTAYGLIAERIRQTDPHRLAFFVTARGVTNEVYYASQKVARFLGTNNVDNAARLCHAPSTGAMRHALGVAASTCSYSDWYGTDLIVFFGSNPANDQPVSTKYLHEARQKGTRIALVNPYLEPGMRRYWVPSAASSALFGTALADTWFPVSQGGDIAFIYGVLKILQAEGGLNTDFINNHTAEWPALKAVMDSLDFESLEAQAGLPKSSMETFARLLMQAKNAVFIWSMGITQHIYGGDAVSMVLNLGLARGYVGRPLNGLMPIRGHSSVQGGAEMGCYATALPGGLPITSENCQNLEKHYNFPIPSWKGLNSVEMVESAGRGELDILYCLGGNFLRTLPNPQEVADSLAKVPLRIHQDILINDQMLIDPADTVVLLPGKTRYEQDDGGTETSTERRIMFSPEIPRPVGEARAEWKILMELAAVTYPDRAKDLGPADGWKMREEIARVVPFYEGVQHLRKTGDAIQYGGSRLCDDGVYPTPDGKAHFKAVNLPTQLAPASPSRKSTTPTATSSQDSNANSRSNSCSSYGSGSVPNAGPASVDSSVASRRFFVSTRRGKQFNTLIYAEIDPLNGAPRDAVLMNALDAESLRLKNGEQIVLSNDIGRYSGRVFICPIAPGNLQIHWPEGNVILPSRVSDPVGGVPDYNAWAQIERDSAR